MCSGYGSEVAPSRPYCLGCYGIEMEMQETHAKIQNARKREKLQCQISEMFVIRLVNAILGVRKNLASLKAIEIRKVSRNVARKEVFDYMKRHKGGGRQD